ncbi:MAG: ADP-ribosylglycohydrolase family protein [Ruminococcus sp.]|nr:ADP-ribosylglycohydrolase family protein [Ruminococcus sp.]
MYDTELTQEFIEKFYGGVLGKIIGVIAGIPFECNRTAGEIQHLYPYINSYFECLFQTYTDDDINGFVFFSKVFDMVDRPEDITPEMAAYIILNYAAENRGMFWWKDSTEMKAYRNLAAGISPELSGSYGYIGSSADTVGGQIFYDSAGLILAGQPELAAEAAGKLASVMHKGEGAVGGSFISACISAAFVENDMLSVVRKGLSVIDPHSKYAAMVRDIISFYEEEQYDWRRVLHHIECTYTTDGFAYDCGAHVVLALLYGKGNFDHTIEICLQSAGDTDCNCGNAGIIAGVFGGCRNINYTRWCERLKDTVICSCAVPCENQVSITRFTAGLIRTYCRLNRKKLPEYIRRAAEDNMIIFAFPYSYQGFEYEFWLNDQYIEPRYISRHEKSILVVPSRETASPPPSGSPYVLKVWADTIRGSQKKYFYKLFTGYHTMWFDNTKYEPTSCTRLYPGQIITAALYTYFNECNMRIYLSVYDSSGNEHYSQPFYLEARKWNGVGYKIPQVMGFIEYLNICIEPAGDSSADSGYDGLDLYVDNIVIHDTPEYKVRFNSISDLLDKNNSYPLLRNFTVAFGDVMLTDEGSVRLYSCQHNQFSPKYQSISSQKEYSIAFTGSMLHQPYKVKCRMKIAGRKGCSVKGYGLMIIAAKGIIDHYAVGFYYGAAAILKSGSLPGEYTVLAKERYTPEAGEMYRLKAYAYGDKIKLALEDKNKEIIELSCHTGADLTGCIGFAAKGCAIDINEYSVVTTT